MGLLLVLARRMVVCLSLFLFHSLFAKMSPNAERTYLMIKPDGVQRGLVGDIIKRFEQKGFKLVARGFPPPPPSLALQVLHFSEHGSKGGSSSERGEANMSIIFAPKIKKQRKIGDTFIT